LTPTSAAELTQDDATSVRVDPVAAQYVGLDGSEELHRVDLAAEGFEYCLRSLPR